ncbi:MAG: Trm112 family protein [Myxococcota bacterium]
MGRRDDGRNPGNKQRDVGTPAAVHGAWTLAPELRRVLVCPRCRGELTDADLGLFCAACNLTYPVVDGVPWLIDERAIAGR